MPVELQIIQGVEMPKIILKRKYHFPFSIEGTIFVDKQKAPKLMDF